MNAVKIKDNVYWVGAIDWNLRNFHGYQTDRGSTYNAYLIIDEKITLIDTVKETFKDEMFSRISSVIDISKIDYLVSNHVEMDHSGSIPALLEKNPNIKIYTSDPAGMKGLSMHFGSFDYTGVKAGSTLSIGKRTLQFVPTPMIHWPDNMVTYCPEDKILFSNDSFGQHYATSSRLDSQINIDEAMVEAKIYYANIVMPYAMQVKGALEIVKGLDVDMIAPSHGIVWTSYIPDIIASYEKWCNSVSKNKAVVVYDSMWHSTEKMAKTIAEALADKGVYTKLMDLKANHNSEVITQILESKYVIVGSPTLNNNMLPTVASFLTYLKGLSPKDKKAFAFGSYGWSGQSIAQVENSLTECGFEIILEKQRINYIPTQEQLRELSEKVTKIVD